MLQSWQRLLELGFSVTLPVKTLDQPLHAFDIIIIIIFVFAIFNTVDMEEIIQMIKVYVIYLYYLYDFL